MSLPVTWLAGADADVQVIFDKAEELYEGAGTDFYLAVEKYLERISQFPASARVYLRRVRRQVMNHYPYGIYYVPEPTRIVVVAVMDLRQDPRQIRRRLLS